MKIERFNYDKSSPYFECLQELNQKGLIVPSTERRLTAAGKEIAQTHFSNILNLDRRVAIICDGLRMGSPDLCEMDAYVREAADVTYQLTDEEQRERIEQYSENKSISPISMYILGAIYSLQEAAKNKVIIVNPRNSPDNNQYISFTSRKTTNVYLKRTSAKIPPEIDLPGYNSVKCWLRRGKFFFGEFEAHLSFHAIPEKGSGEFKYLGEIHIPDIKPEEDGKLVAKAREILKSPDQVTDILMRYLSSKNNNPATE
jgi:hypothetical protein